jgi:DNA-binding response OmpR family regulator
MDGIRVLLVEDADDTRDALAAHLTMSGALVLTAPTALEALPKS